MKKNWIILVFSVLLFGCSTNKQDDPVVDTLAFGIDISQYNGDIDWKSVKAQEKHATIEFIIIRSTMGDDRKDRKYTKNYTNAKKTGFVVGAYHYYDPNENSTLQAQNYIKTVKLEKGDIIPVLDIERVSKVQSMHKLRIGLKNWLDIVEKHYGVRPMIYTGHSFYIDYLVKHGFDDYPLWIAAYSEVKRNDPIVKDAEIHQFAERVSVPGIPAYTDGNDIRFLSEIIIK